MIVSGLAVAIRPLLSSSKHSTEQSESPEQQPSAVVEPARSVAPIALLLITYIIAFPLLGYTFTTLALTWTQLLRSRQGLLRSTLVAIVLTIGVKLLFGRVFSVMLPEGLFESFL